MTSLRKLKSTHSSKRDKLVFQLIYNNDEIISDRYITAAEACNTEKLR